MQRDYIGYLLAVIGITVGAALSWYFYEKSIQSRIPVFRADFLPSTVYDVKQEEKVPLKVMRENGDALTKSVHVARHTFSNVGNLAIGQADVLVPVRVSLDTPDTELLSVAMSRQSRPVVDCKITQDTPKSFLITYRILEQNDGCEVRVFYAGLRAPKYSVSGEIVGVRNIQVRADTVFDMFEKNEKRTFRWQNIVEVLPQATLFAIVSLLAYRIFKNGPQTNRRFAITIALLIGSVSLVIAASRMQEYFSGFSDDEVRVSTKDWVPVKLP